MSETTAPSSMRAVLPGTTTEENSGNCTVISDFLAQLNAAEFIPRSRVPLKDGQLSIFDKEIYHLYFKMNNGTTVHLRLCEDGYVLYQGLLPLCVQVPKESFDTLLELLDRLP